MSISKAKTAWISSLQIKKFRQKYHKFTAEGDKIVQELLRDSNWVVRELYALDTWLTAHADLWKEKGMEVVVVSESELQRISAHPSPNQVLAVADQRELGVDYAALPQSLTLFLDGVQDPGNLGAVLRIADWFGIKQVLLGPGTVDMFNPKAIQASMGAFLRLHIAPCHLEELEGRNLIVAGADLNGIDLFSFEPSGSGVVLILGNEGNGISEQAKQHLDVALTIPAAPDSGTESLNVSVAAGIMCAVLSRKMATGA